MTYIYIVTMCMLGNFASFCRLMIFVFKINVITFQKCLSDIPYNIRLLQSLDPDQDRHNVGPDLGPNYLQRLSANDKIRRHQGKRQGGILVYRHPVSLIGIICRNISEHALYAIHVTYLSRLVQIAIFRHLNRRICISA